MHRMPPARTRAAIMLVAVLMAVMVAPLFATALLIVLLPGFVTANALFRRTPAPRRVILGFGCGLSIITLLTYLTAFTPAPFRSLLYTVIAGSIGVAAYRHRDVSLDRVPRPGWPVVAITVIAFLGILSRVLPVVSMQAPMFADPAVEGTLARLIVQHNGLPSTWAPFLPIDLHHQPGFAGIVAALHTVSGITIPRIVLLLSNLLYALLPLTVYVAGAALFDARRGTVAAFMALLFSFPAFTFVAGMNAANAGFFLVPLLLGAIIAAADEWDRRHAAGIALLGAGMTIIHPLPLFVTGLTAGTYLLVRFVDAPSRARLWRYGKTGAAAFIAPLLATLPYYLSTIRGSSGLARAAWNIQSRYINPDYELALWQVIEPFYTIFHNPYGIWYLDFGNISLTSLLTNNPIANIGVFLAVIATAVILRRRDRDGGIILLWYLLFLGLSTVQSVLQVRFPGWQFVYPSRMKFFMVLPLSLLLSYATLVRYRIRFRDVAVPVAVAAAVLIAPWSLANTYGYLHHFTAEPDVSAQDREAIDYLGQHAPRDAVVLNMIVDVEAGAFVGGPGQWIPAYTGNPVIFPATSLTGNVSRVQDRTAFMDAINGRDADRFTRLVDRYNVSYIYLSNNTMQARTPYRQPSAGAIRSVCSCEIVFGNTDAAVFRIS